MDTKRIEQIRSTPGRGTKHRTKRLRQHDVRVICWVCLKDMTVREQYYASSAHLPPVCAMHWAIGERVRDDSGVK